MASWPSIFDLCKPRREVLAGEPDAIFAADLWDVISGTAHKDYRDPVRFFTGTHPTENLKLLVKEVSERLAGVSGGTPIFRLETGFGGGKTHSLIAAVHVAREGTGWLRSSLTTASRSSPPGEGAAFVGEESDPSAAMSTALTDSASARIRRGDNSRCSPGDWRDTSACARMTSRALHRHAAPWRLLLVSSPFWS